MKYKIQNLSAKTENQANYIRSVLENQITITTGPAGSGKSLIASYMAAQYFVKNKVNKIILSRPLMYAGCDIGALRGTLDEKVMPHFRAMEENMKLFFGADGYSKLLKENKIQFQPLELMRGATFHNSFMILTEAQNCTKDQIKMFLTRMGQETTVIVEGDTNQSDLDCSGLKECITKLQDVKNIGIIELQDSDIQRNELIKLILQRLR